MAKEGFEAFAADATAFATMGVVFGLLRLMQRKGELTAADIADLERLAVDSIPPVPGRASEEARVIVEALLRAIRRGAT